MKTAHRITASPSVHAWSRRKARAAARRRAALRREQAPRNDVESLTRAA